MSSLEQFASRDFTICEACGQQYSCEHVATCFVCEDERQFVPSTGQSWTTLARMRSKGYRNDFMPLPGMTPDTAFSIQTLPKFAIGQRAILLLDSKEGNTLWDCVTFLDQDTVDFINSRGGISRICISHPHYYSTALDWARAFSCPVFVDGADQAWVTRPPAQDELAQGICHTPLDLHTPFQVTSSLKLHRVGGHFDGSTVLHMHDHGGALFVGDTLSLTPGNRRVTIMWSYPNMIPLDARTVADVCWPRLKPLQYEKIFSKFVGEDLLSGGDMLVRQSLLFYCEKLQGDTSAFEADP